MNTNQGKDGATEEGGRERERRRRRRRRRRRVH